MSYLKHSHAASGSQSRAIIDGLDADIVTRLSTTILVAESAGRPFVYRKRSRADDATNKFPAQRVNATNGESILTAPLAHATTAPTVAARFTPSIRAALMWCSAMAARSSSPATSRSASSPRS